MSHSKSSADSATSSSIPNPVSAPSSQDMAHPLPRPIPRSQSFNDHIPDLTSVDTSTFSTSYMSQRQHRANKRRRTKQARRQSQRDAEEYGQSPAALPTSPNPSSPSQPPPTLITTTTITPKPILRNPNNPPRPKKTLAWSEDVIDNANKPRLRPTWAAEPKSHHVPLREHRGYFTPGSATPAKTLMMSSLWVVYGIVGLRNGYVGGGVNGMGVGNPSRFIDGDEEGVEEEGLFEMEDF
ncbi:hypothetical protein EJ08DRAFT_662580 [Tothia fuscella]|uniref:Uncharacterized protein n=1 Tax=Tothia fuscella TaxID=1048955 RepID=A0A9P4NMU4_9PEZI|nr:hypothetical protein EJ08DRAFT_662580 [Tothia fuscella]